MSKQALDEFGDFVQHGVSLAPLTWFRIGGPAAHLARPRNESELSQIWKRAVREHLPCRVLAGGSNVLVRDDGVAGVVIHLESPAFSDVSISGNRVVSGAAVPLTALISHTARAGLAGIEALTGIPGTIGGALRGNAGGRTADLNQFVRRVTVLDPSGEIRVRERDELDFTDHPGPAEDPIIISVELELSHEDPESVVKRMRRIWIVKKENQPYGHESSGMIFHDPSPEVSARMVIEQSGLMAARNEHVEVSPRHANFFIADAEARAADVLSLIDWVRNEVSRLCGVDLDLRLQVW